MNEIERAVAEIVGSNYGECQCHRETMMLAAEALREQAERSKECSSCDGGFGDNTVEFEKLGYAICPHCGRRLEVEQDG